MDTPSLRVAASPNPPETWTARACAGSDLTLFYGPPEDGPGAYDEPVEQRRWRERRAVQVCADCPVLARCLADELALPVQHQHGVRGGMTALERRALLRRQHSAEREAAELDERYELTGAGRAALTADGTAGSAA